mgnify:CR=1 FL=1
MALTTEARADLLEALQPLVAEIAEDLRVRLLKKDNPARVQAKKLYDEEVVGDALSLIHI